MLVDNIEDDCDKQILKKSRGYAAKLNSMMELYLKTTREADEFKIKHKLYVINYKYYATQHDVSDKQKYFSK